MNGSLNLSRALGDMEYKQASALGPEAQIVTAVPEARLSGPCMMHGSTLPCASGMFGTPWRGHHQRQRARGPREAGALSLRGTAQPSACDLHWKPRRDLWTAAFELSQCRVLVARPCVRQQRLDGWKLLLCARGGLCKRKQ